MAHIYIYSPSGAVRDKAAFKRGVARLKQLGHEVEVDANALSSVQRFAGDDQTRLAAVSRACASGADLAMISRGGYGITRMLDRLPYKAMAKAADKGMRWVGASDFTAMQAALYAKTGAVSWAGPVVTADLGSGDSAEGHDAQPDDIMEACFDDLAQGVCEGSGWTLPKSDTSNLIANNEDGMRAKGSFLSKNAIIWGGNLCTLTSLIGTPYLPSIDKGILWFEDVAEHPYRVERMLSQWLNAGILQRQRAVIFGQFTAYQLSSHDKGFNMRTVTNYLRSQLKCPVLTGLPFGHVPTKVCLPFGAKTSLMVDGRDALLYWG
jgi:muramoyltetrapeptide carboxypeptidase